LLLLAAVEALSEILPEAAVAAAQAVLEQVQVFL